VRATLLRLLSSLTLIVLLAFACRIAFALYEASLVSKVVLATVPFENEAGNIAQALARGDGFCCVFRQPTGPTAWLAPVYPLLLSGIFKLFGTFTVSSFYVAALLNCVFSSLVCIPLYFAGERIGGIFAGALAAWIWVLFPSGIILPFEWIWDTSLSALLAATLLWATLRLAGSIRLRYAAGYGVLWGFSLMANPALGSLLPFFLGWIAFRQIRLGHWNPRPLVLALLLTITMCVPWTIRNALQFHKLIPLRSNFPFELWIGNNEIYDQHSREVNRITRYEQVRHYQELGETAFLAEKWQKATSFIAAHPGLSLRLAGRRFVATWFGTSAPWRDFLHADSSLVRFLLFWNAVTVIGVLAALGRLLAARSPFVFPLAIFLLVFPLIYYFTQTSLRLRHPCDPVLALLLALSISSVMPSTRKSPQRTR
jgi:hypothetical protein